MQMEKRTAILLLFQQALQTHWCWLTYLVQVHSHTFVKYVSVNLLTCFQFTLFYMCLIIQAAISEPNPFPTCPSGAPAEVGKIEIISFLNDNHIWTSLKPSKTSLVTTAKTQLQSGAAIQMYDSGSGPRLFKTCDKTYFYLTTADNVCQNILIVK